MANLRFDLVLSALDETGNAGDTIAILEYKKTDMIDYSDFEEALCREDKVSSKLGTVSKLMNNGATYMRQISTYAKARGCPHVALFNWQHFLALVFDLQDKDPRFTTRGKADLTWVSEVEAREFVHKEPIRQAMLGWLLRAFRAKLGDWKRAV